MCICLFTRVFIRQKPAYDMRIGDWRSDVCSSGLADRGTRRFAHHRQTLVDDLFAEVADVQMHHVAEVALDRAALALLVPECLAEPVARTQFGRAASRARGFTYV